MPMRPLVRLIYASRSRGGPAVQHAVSIRRAAEEYNPRHGITGAMVATNQRFLQILEGPGAAVIDLYARIAKDPRHQDCTLLQDTEIDFRLWPDWSMRLLSDLQFERRASERHLDVNRLPDDPERALDWIDLLYSFVGDSE